MVVNGNVIKAIQIGVLALAAAIDGGSASYFSTDGEVARRLDRLEKQMDEVIESTNLIKGWIKGQQDQR